MTQTQTVYDDVSNWKRYNTKEAHACIHMYIYIHVAVGRKEKRTCLQ